MKNSLESSWLQELLKKRRTPEIIEPPDDLEFRDLTYFEEFHQRFSNSKADTDDDSDANSDEETAAKSIFPKALNEDLEEPVISIEDEVDEATKNKLLLKIFNLPYKLTDSEVPLSI